MTWRRRRPSDAEGAEDSSERPFRHNSPVRARMSPEPVTEAEGHDGASALVAVADDDDRASDLTAVTDDDLDADG